MSGTPNKSYVELVFGVHPAPIAAIISGHAVMTSTGADPGILAVASDPSLTLIGSFLKRQAQAFGRNSLYESSDSR
jgi:hypothetical protein